MTKERKQEYTLRITQANKTMLSVILYEMILDYADEAKEAYRQENRVAYREAIRKMRGCIHELMQSLHLEYELAVQLLQLYLYVNRELAAADVRNNPEPLDHIEMVIRGLHESYEELVKQDDSGPVMLNTQTVYAGLTYGKNQLTEDMADQSMNRGLRV